VLAQAIADRFELDAVSQQMEAGGLFWITSEMYDLLNAAAKGLLYPGGTFGPRIRLAMTRLNSSNVAGVPTADPCDHICGVSSLCMLPDQITLVVSSWLNPCGTASLRVLA
jgi:hypothetical protein